jgi:hypothetical protein
LSGTTSHSALSTQSVFEQRVIPGFSPYRCNGFMVRRRRLLPPGYGPDTPDGGTWALRRPDGARRHPTSAPCIERGCFSHTSRPFSNRRRSSSCPISLLRISLPPPLEPRASPLDAPCRSWQNKGAPGVRDFLGGVSRCFCPVFAALPAAGILIPRRGARSLSPRPSPRGSPGRCVHRARSGPRPQAAAPGGR